MTLAQSRREILAAEYARLRKIGDRAGAKRIWAELHAITNECLNP